MKKKKKEGRRKSAFHYGTRYRYTLNWTQYPRYLSSLLIHEITRQFRTSLCFIIPGDNDNAIFLSRHARRVKLNIRSNDRRNYGGLPFFFFFFNDFAVFIHGYRNRGNGHLNFIASHPQDRNDIVERPPLPRYTRGIVLTTLVESCFDRVPNPQNSSTKISLLDEQRTFLYLIASILYP